MVVVLVVFYFQVDKRHNDVTCVACFHFEKENVMQLFCPATTSSGKQM